MSVGKELDADVCQSDSGGHGPGVAGRSRLELEDEQRLEALNDELWAEQDEGEDPEQADEPDGAPHRVSVAGLQWPADGVVPTATGNRRNLHIDFGRISPSPAVKLIPLVQLTVARVQLK